MEPFEKVGWTEQEYVVLKEFAEEVERRGYDSCQERFLDETLNAT